MELNRRKFLSACGSVCLINGLQLGLSRQSLAAANKPHTLIYVFLRGGIDGLNLITPTDGEARANYENYRNYGKYYGIALERPGKSNGVIELTNNWGLNPDAAPLKEIWQDKNIAVIHATGLPEGYSSRSHFESMRYIERGITANFNQSNSILTGWLTRYMNTIKEADNSAIPALSSGGASVESLSGYNKSASLTNLNDYSPLIYSSLFEDNYLKTLNDIYSNSTALDKAVNNATEVIKTVKQIDIDSLKPPSVAKYPKNSSGNLLGISKDFHRVAQLIRAKPEMGVHTATINVGGWDTHEYQNSYFPAKIKQLSEAILAFYKEMKVTGNSGNYTMIIQSEFGRRVRQNGNRGTDHGTGNIMMILGDKVRGGNFYGQAPTLSESTLFGREDIAVTTDYRKVIREVLNVGLNVNDNNLEKIFPHYTDQSILNFMESPILFSDGFE